MLFIYQLAYLPIHQFVLRGCIANLSALLSSNIQRSSFLGELHIDSCYLRIGFFSCSTSTLLCIRLILHHYPETFLMLHNWVLRCTIGNNTLFFSSFRVKALLGVLLRRLHFFRWLTESIYLAHRHHPHWCWVIWNLLWGWLCVHVFTSTGLFGI